MSVIDFQPSRPTAPASSVAAPSALKGFLLSLRRVFPVVIALMVLGTLLGYAAERALPRRYTSSVSILIDPKRPNSYGAEEAFANLYVDTNKISSVELILVSSSLLSKVVKAENLAADPEFGDARPSRLRALLDLIPGWREAPEPDTQEWREERALARLAQAVKTTRIGMTYVIMVNVSAPSPATAKRLAQAVVDAYLADQLEMKYAAAQRDTAWLTDRLSQLRGELIRSEQAVEAIRTKYGLTQTDGAPGSTAERQMLTDINTQLAQAEGEVATSQARYDEAERIRQSGGNLEGLPEVESSKVIGGFRQQQADLNRVIADLAAHTSANYPGRIRAEEDRKALNAEVAAEVARIVDGLHSAAQAAIARRDALKKQLSQLVNTASGSTSVEGRAQLREAERVADANRTVYDASLARLREVEQQQTRQEVEARIISGPFEPDAPSSPKPVIFVGGGGVLGLLGGLALAFLLPRFERRVVNPASAEHILSLPILATIPQLTPRDLARGARSLRPTEYLSLNPLSRFAESLRALRIGLRMSSKNAPRVIQFTSALPGEGKSTIAASMALSAAATGVHTVLVDLDLYNPAISRIFDLGHRAGVVDVLLGDAVTGSALQTHHGSALRIVGAGSATQPRPDMIETSQFRTFIEGLTKDFDLVVLDTPPVLAVSNPLMIAGLADVTLLVVAWRDTHQSHVDQAAGALRGAGAPLAGIVLNKVDLSRIGRYDGKPYGYQGLDYGYRPTG